ncbi:MAG: hypothetical protein ABFD14_08040 [Anaerolineaceae bacterium]
MINPKKMIEILHSIFVIDDRDTGLAKGNWIGMLNVVNIPSLNPYRKMMYEFVDTES